MLKKEVTMEDRLKVGQEVLFNASPRTEFCKGHIKNGAKCKVIAVLPNTVIVRFNGQEETDIVAPAYIALC